MAGAAQRPRVTRASQHYFFFLGTFAPDFRASLRAIATACLRLFTFLPLPDLNVRCLCSFMTLWILRFPLLPVRDVECECDDFVAILRSP
jgi:hypothetical protein